MNLRFRNGFDANRAGFLLFLGLAFLFLFCIFSKKVESDFAKISKSDWPAWNMLACAIKQSESRLFRRTVTSFENCPTYDSALQLFLDKKVDAATLTIYEALVAYDKYPNDVEIVLLLDYTIGSDAVVAKKSIQYLTDLSGKTIAVELGTISHFTLLKAIEKSGVPLSRIKIYPYSVQAINDPLLLGKVDAISTYEPYISNLKKYASFGFHPIFSSKEIPRSICDVLIVRRSFAKAHPGIIQHWKQSWFEATKGPSPFILELFGFQKKSNCSIALKFPGIYLTNELENQFAFGTKLQPGYLAESILEMASFMKKQLIVSVIPTQHTQILYYSDEATY